MIDSSMMEGSPIPYSSRAPVMRRCKVQGKPGVCYWRDGGPDGLLDCSIDGDFTDRGSPRRVLFPADHVLLGENLDLRGGEVVSDGNPQTDEGGILADGSNVSTAALRAMHTQLLAVRAAITVTADGRHGGLSPGAAEAIFVVLSTRYARGRGIVDGNGGTVGGTLGFSWEPAVPEPKSARGRGARRRAARRQGTVELKVLLDELATKPVSRAELLIERDLLLNLYSQKIGLAQELMKGLAVGLYEAHSLILAAKGPPQPHLFTGNIIIFDCALHGVPEPIFYAERAIIDLEGILEAIPGADRRHAFVEARMDLLERLEAALMKHNTLYGRERFATVADRATAALHAFDVADELVGTPKGRN